MNNRIMREQMESHRKQETVLRLLNVKVRTGLSRSTIYLEIKNGNFPKPIQLGTRCVGWLESEIEGWIAGRIQKTRSAQKTGA